MEEGKERGGIVTWFSGMRKSFSSNIPANRERSLKVINKHSSRDVNRSFIQLSGL